MENSKSPHILNTSANLFGLCFVVFTYVRTLKLGGQTYLDECVAVSMLMFMLSCIFSFLSIRSETVKTMLYEKVADYIFIAGMFTLFLTTILVILVAL